MTRAGVFPAAIGSVIITETGTGIETGIGREIAGGRWTGGTAPGPESERGTGEGSCFLGSFRMWMSAHLAGDPDELSAFPYYSWRRRPDARVAGRLDSLHMSCTQFVTWGIVCLQNRCLLTADIRTLQRTCLSLKQ